MAEYAIEREECETCGHDKTSHYSEPVVDPVTRQVRARYYGCLAIRCHACNMYKPKQWKRD